MKKIKALFKKYREVIMYLIFGVLTTFVSWGSYAAFESLFSTFISNSFLSVAISNVLSWIAAVLFAYITNKLWVFNSKSFKRSVIAKEITSFVGSRIATGVLEWAGVPLLMWIGLNQSIFGIEGMLAKVIISVLVVILNYVLSKIFVFKNKKK